MHGGDVHAAIDDFTQYVFLAAVGLGAERGALQDFAEIYSDSTEIRKNPLRIPPVPILLAS